MPRIPGGPSHNPSAILQFCNSAIIPVSSVTTTGKDPLIGKLVSHYEIVAKLGGGAMGVVYSARDKKLGRLVALKFLPPQWSHDETAIQRLIREAQTASATAHRNLCTIHDIESTDDGELFIVMAYYSGQTLKQRLEQGELKLEDALEFAAQVSEGLAKAHAQGVVHRDIKPGNLMITDDCVTILDFGLAKASGSLQLTITGSQIGTVAYMSPEQARGDEADVRSDIWAVGVVLFEMLAGRVPFAGDYPEAVFHAIKNEPVPALRKLKPDIPEAVEHLVDHALQKDRQPALSERARDRARVATTSGTARAGGSRGHRERDVWIACVRGARPTGSIPSPCCHSET